MGLHQTSLPLTYPVNAVEAASHLRLTGEIPTELATYIAAATEYIERATGMQLCTAGYVLTLDHFPCGRVIRLPRPPLQAVSSVSYMDPAGNEQTLAADRYTVDTSTLPGRLVLNPGYMWPATLAKASAVRIAFSAGYGAAGDVPYLLSQAVKFLAGHYYENREGISEKPASELPLAVTSIIDLFKFVELV